MTTINLTDKFRPVIFLLVTRELLLPLINDITGMNTRGIIAEIFLSSDFLSRLVIRMICTFIYACVCNLAICSHHNNFQSLQSPQKFLNRLRKYCCRFVESVAVDNVGSSNSYKISRDDCRSLPILGACRIVDISSSILVYIRK